MIIIVTDTGYIVNMVLLASVYVTKQCHKTI